jgi:hypothetical protein
MTEDWRDEEVRMREEAQAHAGEIVEGSGTRGSPRRLPQMVSVRLDARLVVALRALARQRGLTMSDLLREGAECVLEGQHTEEARTYITTVSGASEPLRTRSGPEERVYALLHE